MNCLAWFQQQTLNLISDVHNQGSASVTHLLGLTFHLYRCCSLLGLLHAEGAVTCIRSILNVSSYTNISPFSTCTAIQLRSEYISCVSHDATEQTRYCILHMYMFSTLLKTYTNNTNSKHLKICNSISVQLISTNIIC